MTMATRLYSPVKQVPSKITLRLWHAELIETHEHGAGFNKKI